MPKPFDHSVKRSGSFFVLPAIAVILGILATALLISDQGSNPFAEALGHYLAFNLITIVSILLFITGLIVFFIVRNSRFGLSMILSAFLLFISFFGSFFIAKYREETLKPSHPTGLNKVVFKPDATEAQIQSFMVETFTAKRKDLPGDAYVPPVSSAAADRNGENERRTATFFWGPATEAQYQQVRERINSSPIVDKLWENVPPGTKFK